MSVGIDLSWTSTGLARVTQDFVITKAIKTKSSDPWVYRVDVITAGIIEWVGDDEIVYFEGYSFGSSNRREMMGELFGLVRYDLELRGKRIIKIPPTNIKRFATGRGRAPACPPHRAKSTWTKRWMIEEVKKNFRQEFDTDDETDAFVIATMGHYVERALHNPEFLETLPVYQQEEIKKILKEEFKWKNKF